MPPKKTTDLSKATAGAGQPVHTSQIQPAWMRVPGAASMLGRRRRQRDLERDYLQDLYTARGMPTPKILVSDGGPYLRSRDVVTMLGFSPADEEIWAHRVDDWVTRSQNEVQLRTALFANLRDYPEIDPLLRTELARRTLSLFREKRRNAGDFMAKSNPQILVKARDSQGRQSQRGAPAKDRNPPGVGRHPGRTISSANPPGKGSPAAPGDMRPTPPPTPTDARDTGIKSEDEADAQDGLDTDDLAGGPQNGEHIQKKLESLVDELHALHEHMDDDDDHLVAMHNAIKDKMRDAYNDATPEGLREIQHLLHHFHEIVLGAPEAEPDDEEAPPPRKGQPPAGKPPMMRKSTGPIFFDFI